MTVKSPRPYVSAVRRAGALATRAAILSAARDLFVKQGFVKTTIDQICERAGVSKPTVFAAVGNKAQLLKDVRDVAIAGDGEPLPIMERGWYRAMLAEPDAARTLRLYAHHVTAINDRYAEVDAVLHEAAGADADLGRLWKRAEDERLRGAEVIVDNIKKKGTLRLDRRLAVAVLWVLTAPDQLRRLVRIRGWTLSQFERWLADVSCEQLLTS